MVKSVIGGVVAAVVSVAVVIFQGQEPPPTWAFMLMVLAWANLFMADKK